ncbi:universal stress protein [Streptomyces sp. NPDC005485]|uniref:universal stress protein n=1 Tax=Streptomyces sp. NPDC005485 TaxID=3155591 RepID=UPI0033BCAF3B
MNTGTRTVTVGIDGSRTSLDAADWAAREAERRHLPLRLLQAGIAPTSPVRVPDVDVPAGRIRTALDRAAIQLSYAHPALDIIARSTETPAVPALLEAAAQSETLVLGSRGFTGFAGFLVGSVALEVSARAERPVVLVRAGELPEDERNRPIDGTPPDQAPYLPVVLGLDVDHPADDLIGYAFDAAASRSTALHVLHTWTLPLLRGCAPGVPLPDVSAEREEGKWHVLSATLQPWRHKFPETDVREEVVYGHPGHHLLKASTGAGLLVIGRRTGTGEAGAGHGTGLGRAAHSLIHHATCPVAVVPHT